MNILAHLIKQHANLPDFTTVLLDPHENPIDLTSATSVVFRMQLVGDPSITGGGAVEIIEEESGTVSYEFTGLDTAISGTYLATIQITFPGGKLQTLPFNDYWIISIEPDLEEDPDDLVAELVFATTADARAMGLKYSDLSVDDLLRAQGHIEVMCGRMVERIQEAIENEAISRSDIARLKKATV